jgi:hypothetical protein
MRKPKKERSAEEAALRAEKAALRLALVESARKKLTPDELDALRAGAKAGDDHLLNLILPAIIHRGEVVFGYSMKLDAMAEILGHPAFQVTGIGDDTRVRYCNEKLIPGNHWKLEPEHEAVIDAVLRQEGRLPIAERRASTPPVTVHAPVPVPVIVAPRPFIAPAPVNTPSTVQPQGIRPGVTWDDIAAEEQNTPFAIVSKMMSAVRQKNEVGTPELANLIVPVRTGKNPFVITVTIRETINGEVVNWGASIDDMGCGSVDHPNILRDSSGKVYMDRNFTGLPPTDGRRCIWPRGYEIKNDYALFRIWVNAKGKQHEKCFVFWKAAFQLVEISEEEYKMLLAKLFPNGSPQPRPN